MNKAGGSTIKEKRKRNLFLFQLFIVVGLLALVWFSFGQNVLAPQRQESSIPEYLGSLKLASKTEGSQALAQINRLHGTDIKLVTAYIAEYTYSYGGSRATVWVGRAESTAAAAELIRRMVAGIKDGNQAFSNLQQLTVAGQEIFRVEGSGGEHFFYNSGEKVVWLTIESTQAISIVERAVKTF